MKYIAYTVKFEWNDAVEKQFSKVFDSIDTDGNGKLTFDEVKEKVLKTILRRMNENPTDSEIKLFMDGIDKDGDGAVSKDELRDWLKELIAILQDPKKSLAYAAEVMFRACDTDADGRISKQEFSKFMKEKGFPLKDSEVTQIFVVVDEDGDRDSLTKQELVRVLTIGKAAKQQQLLQQQQQR